MLRAQVKLGNYIKIRMYKIIYHFKLGRRTHITLQDITFKNVRILSQSRLSRDRSSIT